MNTETMTLDRNRKRSRLTGKIAAACFLLLFIVFMAVPAYAAETEVGASAGTAADTVVLSGTLSENTEIPEEVRLVVLHGILGEGVTLTIDGDATVEIADGTENSLYMIAGLKSLRFTGGGNLDLVFGIMVQGALGVFDHTGTIGVSEGTIMTMGGKLVFNSGTVTVHADDRVGEGIFAVEGDVIVNGGDITSDGKLGAIVAQNNMELNGGRITAVSDTVPVYAAFAEGYVMTVSDRVKESGFDAVKASEDSPAMALSDGKEAKAGEIVLKTEDDTEKAAQSFAEFQEKTAADAEGNDKDVAEIKAEGDGPAEEAGSGDDGAGGTVKEKNPVSFIVPFLLVSAVLTCLTTGILIRKKHEKTTK